MRHAAQSATTMADEYAPEVKLAGDLNRVLRMLNMSTQLRVLTGRRLSDLGCVFIRHGGGRWAAWRTCPRRLKPPITAQ